MSEEKKKMHATANAAAGGSVTKLKMWNWEGKEGGRERNVGGLWRVFSRAPGGEKNEGVAE